MPLPNFLIIGAGRSGTTSLYHYLRQHPQIFMSRIKETSFFAFDGRWGTDRFPIRNLEAYRALFSAAAGERALGEASPFYLVDAAAAGRIRERLPDVKLVVQLRDPAGPSGNATSSSRACRWKCDASSSPCIGTTSARCRT